MFYTNMSSNHSFLNLNTLSNLSINEIDKQKTHVYDSYIREDKHNIIRDNNKDTDIQDDIIEFHPIYKKHLKKAKLINTIGEGGFSKIKLYKCKNKNCNKIHRENGHCCDKIFIVKRLLYDVDSWRNYSLNVKHSRIQQMLWNEFNIGKKLNHPNINKILDIIPSENSLVLEYFNAVDMLEYLNIQTNKDINNLINYFNQLLDGVEYLHSNGVAHMDIKLENVLINLCTNQVKLIDFGQSKVFIDKHNNSYITSNDICGTEIYFPPEFYNRLMYYPDKVDIWCCGIILYNLIYNCMPWDNTSLYNIHFNKFSEYYHDNNALHPKIFPIPTWPNLDVNVLYLIFYNVFAIDYKKRCNINTLLKKSRLLLKKHPPKKFSCDYYYNN